LKNIQIKYLLTLQEIPIDYQVVTIMGFVGSGSIEL